ncbi:MAG: TldD/PmbA family protein [Acidobacteria bacterium]|nr:TldD/PmbA family protein [Acidobacteriota bacterium]
MKKLCVDLVDDSYATYFSIDSADKKEYTIRSKTGILKRNFDDKWTSSSHELTSIEDANDFLDKKIKFKRLPVDFPFLPGKIIKENQFILDSLNELGAMEWKIIFRSLRSQRVIIKNEKDKKATFEHYSILLKVRLKDQANFIEVGEGGPQGPKFNQNGLVSRVKEISDNHKRAEKYSIPLNEKIPVILSPGDGAILFHEILGHALEADYIYLQRSPVTMSHIGRQIMPAEVTVVTENKTDPFFAGIFCDDDGEIPKSPCLIEKGILKNIIADSFYKHLLDIKSGGHSRAEDFTCLPMPRMYALYLKPGNHNPEELISSTPYGVYAREFGEGKIYFDKNLFYFNIHDARLIEKGQRTIPLGSIIVKGDISEVLNSIEMIADDFRFDKGISYCFKNGQTLNVRVGQPTVKINNLWVIGNREYQ